jgi:hypothetical protein
MNRQNTNASTPTYIDLKYSGGQCARRIVVRNCQLPFSIYNEGDPGDVVCENFEMRENSISLGFAATNANHRHIAFTGALSIQHGATVAMNTTGRIDAASFSLGASAIASIAGTLNLTGALNVYGRCEIAAAALLTYASMNIGSQTILTDNRIGGPLNRLGAMVPVTSGGMSFTPTSILDIASRVPVGERHIGTYWSTYSDAPPNFPPSTGGMIKKTLDSAPGTATMNYRITISASAGGLQWWRVVAYTAATNTWAWVVPGDWINQPEWLVNSPNLWPTNGSEVWLADGTFGRRFTGNLVAAAGTDIGTVLTSSLTALTANIVQWGGWFGAGAAATLNKIAVGSASTGAYNSTAHLHLYNSGLGMQTVHNSVARAAPDTGPYDVWVRYTKV